MEVVEPGKWYIFVTCHGCQQPIVLGEDPTHGEDDLVQYERDRETVTCPLCQTTDEYLVTEVQKAFPRPRPSVN